MLIQACYCRQATQLGLVAFLHFIIFPSALTPCTYRAVKEFKVTWDLSAQSQFANFVYHYANSYQEEREAKYLFVWAVAVIAVA